MPTTRTLVTWLTCHLAASFLMLVTAPLSAATLTVTNGSDTGPGTLRQAILDANANPGLDTVAFNLPASGVNIITVSNPLPQITDPIIIDGTTQPGYSNVPVVEIKGTFQTNVSGLTITAGGSTLRALAIGGFGYPGAEGHGVVLSTKGSNTIAGCYVGVDPAGGPGTLANYGFGVLVSNSAYNIIGGTGPLDRNLIGLNQDSAVVITGNSSISNQVVGNLIGLDANGFLAPNRGNGIDIIEAPSTIVGGPSVAARNVISGNILYGVHVTNTSGTIIQGNYLGVDVAGVKAMGNAKGGIQLDAASGSLIGGTNAAARNIIAGNSGFQQVRINNVTPGMNVVQGNYIGLNVAGAGLPAGFADGVWIESPSNTVGGVAAGAGNVISANHYGIQLNFTNAFGNVVQGNFIGTDPIGTNAVANQIGVEITTGAHDNLIGGTTPSAGNLISGNAVDGVMINGGQHISVQGNYIGTDVTGTKAVGNASTNGGAGIEIFSASNLIGGGAGAGNLISGNNSDGIHFFERLATDNQVQGNIIGADITGTNALGNQGNGILFEGASTNRIGAPPFAPLDLQGGQVPSSLEELDAFNFLFGVNFGTIYGEIASTGNQIHKVNVVGNGKGGINGTGNLDEVGFAGNGGSAYTPGSFDAKVSLQAVTISGGKTLFELTVSALPAEVVKVWVYLKASGETLLPLTQNSVVTDSSGNATFNGSIPGMFKVGDTFTALATGLTTGPFAPAFAASGSSPGTGLAQTSANFASAGLANDPVSTFTGELYNLLPPDLNLGGPMPLLFQRYYASLLQQDGLVNGALGNNWLHNFEMKLTVTPSNTVQVLNEFGRLIVFTNNSGVYTLLGRQDIPFQLATTGTNFVLGDPRTQRLHTFDPTGRLIKTEDGHGNAHLLAYNGAQLANVTDGLGRSLTFQYDAGGFLTNVSDGTRSVVFGHAGSILSSAQDARGQVTTYAYDLTNTHPGLLTQTVLPDGSVPYRQVFDANGRVVSQTAAGTNTTTLSYSNNVTTMIDPLGNVQQQVHTPTGELASFTDEADQAITLGSNGAGQRSSVTDRLGHTTAIAHHAPSGNPSGITNADGTVTTFTYTNRTVSGITFYDLSRITYPDGTSESFSYDGAGNVLFRTDRAGRVVAYTYNGHGQVLTAQNPLGGVVTYTYNSDGTLNSRSDSDLGPTTFAYDNLRRLQSLTRPDAALMLFGFDENDQLNFVGDENNNLTIFTHDLDDRIGSIIDADSQASKFAYDSFSRIARLTDRLGKSSGFAYDQRGHLATLTNRNGNVTALSYDARQRLATVTDPGVKVWSFGYDNEAIPLSFTNPLAQAAFRGTDALGYDTSYTNELGQVTTLGRDSMRRVINVVDALSRTNQYGYEARGLLAAAGVPLLGAAQYLRNGLGSLSQVTGLNGEPWRFAYTAMGRLRSMADPLNRTNTFAYDARGRLTQTAYADGVTRSNAYDPASNLTRRSYSDGTDLPYAYDKLNRLTNADQLVLAYDLEGRITNSQTAGFNFGATYDAGGRLTSVAYASGTLTVFYTYDTRDRLTRVKDSLTGGQMDFTHDDAGRLIGVTRANGVNGTYTWDAAGRRTRIQEGTIIDLQYTLDAAGEVSAANFTAPLDPASFTNPSFANLAYDAAHQLNAAGYAFDPRGRQTAAPAHTFTWDGASRLRQIDGVTLAYNGLNDLDTRAVAGVTNRAFHHYALALAPIVAEATAGVFTRYYVWSPGGRLLYMIDVTKANAVSYFHFDRVGSTLALTSDAGAVTDAYAYSPYGVLLGRTGTNLQPFTYIGELGVRSEPAANLYHMRARYYDPAAARFLTPDPIWPRLANPQSLNPYAYAARNPLIYVDAEGTQPTDEPTREQLRTRWILALLSLLSDDDPVASFLGRFLAGDEYAATLWPSEFEGGDSVGWHPDTWIHLDLSALAPIEDNVLGASFLESPGNSLDSSANPFDYSQPFEVPPYYKPLFFGSPLSVPGPAPNSFIWTPKSWPIPTAVLPSYARPWSYIVGNKPHSRDDNGHDQTPDERLQILTDHH